MTDKFNLKTQYSRLIYKKPKETPFPHQWRLWWQCMILVMLSILPYQIQAQLSGEDSFNDGSKDPEKWDSDFRQGSGVARERNGRFLFSSTSSRGESEAGWPWIFSSAPYNQDWTIQADVTNELVVTDASQYASIGIYVASLQDESDLAFIELYASFQDGGETPTHGFASGLVNNQGNLHEGDSLDLPITEGAIQVRFDAGTKTLTFLYHTGSVENGYAWRRLAHYGIDGNDGLEANDPWRLNGNSEFDIGIYGFSNNVSVSEGLISLDQFNTEPGPSAAQPPFEVFFEENENGGTEIWWEAYDGFDYTLHTSLNLRDWNISPLAIKSIGDWHFAPISMDSPSQYYRVESTQR